MSANYYFKFDVEVKFTNLNDKPIPCELQHWLDSIVKGNNTLHIGKRSAGWEPTFHSSRYYESVQDIYEFYNECKEFLIIVDEYGDELSFEELEGELVNWRGGKAGYKKHEVSDVWQTYRDSEGYYFCRGSFS